ncbi:hypothetical protein L7F22_034110 [Adiantum nelumboides]|nr:hypothetical protein [Adiantum nelumboides]
MLFLEDGQEDPQASDGLGGFGQQKAVEIDDSAYIGLQVDEHGHNPSWRAIGYCGPDPAAVEHRKTAEKTERKPLEGRVFDASASKEGLALHLKEAGFEVLKDVEYMASLWKQDKLGQEKARNAIEVKCDAVVVGSGSGGGVAASWSNGWRWLCCQLECLFQNSSCPGRVGP